MHFIIFAIKFYFYVKQILMSNLNRKKTSAFSGFSFASIKCTIIKFLAWEIKLKITLLSTNLALEIKSKGNSKLNYFYAFRWFVQLFRVSNSKLSIGVKLSFFRFNLIQACIIARRVFSLAFDGYFAIFHNLLPTLIIFTHNLTFCCVYAYTRSHA